MSDNCTFCLRDFKGNYVVVENDNWLVRHSEETNILGYFILQPKRHILDLAEASEKECMDYAILLKTLMACVKKITQCKRVYTFSLAEAVPHYHLHVIPRAHDFPRAYVGRGITNYPLAPKAPEGLVEEACFRARKLLVPLPV